MPPERVAARSFEVLTDVLEPDRPFELLQRDGPQIGEDVVADLAGDRFGMRQRLGVEDDRRLQPDPGVLRRAEIGDDRRQIIDRRRLGGGAAVASAGFAAVAELGRIVSKAPPTAAPMQDDDRELA